MNLIPNKEGLLNYLGVHPYEKFNVYEKKSKSYCNKENEYFFMDVNCALFLLNTDTDKLTDVSDLLLDLIEGIMKGENVLEI